MLNIYNSFLRNVICDTPEWMPGAVGLLSTLFILLDVETSSQYHSLSL